MKIGILAMALWGLFLAIGYYPDKFNTFFEADVFGFAALVLTPWQQWALITMRYLWSGMCAWDFALSIAAFNPSGKREYICNPGRGGFLGATAWILTWPLAATINLAHALLCLPWKNRKAYAESAHQQTRQKGDDALR